MPLSLALVVTSWPDAVVSLGGFALIAFVVWVVFS